MTDSSDVFRPADLDFAFEANVLRHRAADAFEALHVLSFGSTNFVAALTAIGSLRARCDVISHELALRYMQPTIEAMPEPIERPIGGDLMGYIIAVEEAGRALTLTT